MITLMMTDATKSQLTGGTSSATAAPPEAGNSFAAMVAGDQPIVDTPTGIAPATDAAVHDENGVPAVDADITGAEGNNVLVAPTGVPKKPPAASDQSPDVPVGQPAVQPQAKTKSEQAAVPVAAVHADKPFGTENSVGRVPDSAPQRGVSSAQNMIEGHTQRASALPSEVPTKAAVDRPATPVKSDHSVQTAPDKIRMEEQVTTIVPTRTANAPDTAILARSQRAADEPDHVEKRKESDGRIAANVGLAPAQLPSAPVVPQPSAAVQTMAQAMAGDRHEQDGKLLDRELAIGSASQDRPIAASGSTVHASPSANQEMARSAAQQLSVAVAQGSGKTTEIALNPEELGRVRLTLSAGDGSLTLTVIAERPETQELLRRNIEMLAQEFRALGYQDLSFSFGGEGEAAQSETSGEDEKTAQSNMAEIDRATANPAPQITSGLDLRL